MKVLGTLIITILVLILAFVSAFNNEREDK